MNDRSRELLSAHLDGALTEGEAVELARRWSDDDTGLEDTARRYRVVGEYLRRNAGMGSGDGGVCLLERVRSEVAREPMMEPVAVLGAGARRRVSPTRRWVRPLTALAMAAGIAAVAVGGLRFMVANDTDFEDAGSMAVARAPAGSPGGSLAAASDGWLETGGWSGAAQPTVRKRLNLYLANHSEATGGGALPPYVRVVGHWTANDRE